MLTDLQKRILEIAGVDKEDATSELAGRIEARATSILESDMKDALYAALVMANNEGPVYVGDWDDLQAYQWLLTKRLVSKAVIAGSDRQSVLTVLGYATMRVIDEVPELRHEDDQPDPVAESGQAAADDKEDPVDE